MTSPAAASRIRPDAARRPAPLTATRPFRYLLGDSRSEAARLRRQARLWDPVSRAFLDRIGVRRGWKVLEIGPGQGSLHMELRRRVAGPVDAVERSAAFARSLRARIRRDGLGRGRLWECALSEAPLPARRYDLVFVRWVFLFLPDPLAHLRILARALRPGGLLAVQDYHRSAWSMIPEPEDWRAFVAADRRFFAAEGGDASIGTRLPPMLGRLGMRVLSVVPTIPWGRPGSLVWRWVTDYFEMILDRYAKFPPLSPSRARRLRRQWRAAGRNRASLLVAPAVLDVLARKPRTGA